MKKQKSPSDIVSSWMDSLSAKEKEKITSKVLEDAYESPVILQGKEMTWKEASEKLFELELVYAISYVIHTERNPIEIEIIE